jgi:hypothetical protein
VGIAESRSEYVRRYREASMNGMADFQRHGLLWLFNTSVLHPQGYAMAIDPETGEWSILGDGSEPWMFGEECIEEFDAVQELLRRNNED